MCGIAGVVRQDQGDVPGELIVGMTRALAHRGPDGEGFLSLPGVALGHRRLSVIDLSTLGKQPLSNEDHSVWVTFNGEIYNFKELRRSLEARGHVFRSHTDTEVLVHLYEEYGREMVQHLRGMFAFAIWDARARRLFLARDRFGIKPLYYCQRDGELRFGSEIKALLVDPAIPKDIDFEALNAYLAQRYIAAPRTLLKGIRQLAPGQIAEYDEHGGLRISTYWRPTFEPNLTEANWLERLDDTLRGAVRSHLVADVPFGALLSSGVDASLLLYLVTREHGGTAVSFTADFAEPTFSEGKMAAAIAKSVGAENLQTTISAPTVDELSRIIHHADEPLADASVVPFYHVCGLARQHVTVALSGEGADELFAGYETYVASTMAAHYQRMPGVLRAAVRGFVDRLPHRETHISVEEKLRRFVHGAEYEGESSHLAWREIFKPAQRQALLKTAGTYDSRPPGHEHLSQLQIPDQLNRLLYLDQAHYLPSDMLVKADRMSMAHGLEIRVPYLDHEVVQLAASMPCDIKLRGFNQRKWILRQLADKLLPLPPEKKKHGFNVPLAQWFRGPLRGPALDLLSPSNLRNSDMLNSEVPSQILSEHLSRKRDNSHEVFLLIVLMLWQNNLSRVAPKISAHEVSEALHGSSRPMMSMSMGAVQ